MLLCMYARIVFVVYVYNITKKKQENEITLYIFETSEIRTYRLDLKNVVNRECTFKG